MTTVMDLVSDALIDAGVIAPGESPTGEMARHGMRTLNRMIDQWNIDDLMVYSLQRQVFTLTPGQASRTIGIGGNFNVTAPTKIEMASVQDPANPVEIPIQILTDEEWRDVTVKSTSSSFPLEMWIQQGAVMDTLYFWPVPLLAWELVLYTWTQTAEFTDVNDVVRFPAGYQEALVSNLTIFLQNAYGRPVDPALQLRAYASKDKIAAINSKPLYACPDRVARGASMAHRSRGRVVD